MSRVVNVNDPESWSADDIAYLRERVDQVPEQHRHLLVIDVPRSSVRSVGDILSRPGTSRLLRHSLIARATRSGIS